jgi:hypothetical protein
VILPILLSFPAVDVAATARGIGWILQDHARSCSLSEHLILLRAQGFTGFRFVAGPQVRCVGPFMLVLTLPAQPGFTLPLTGVPIWVAENGTVSCPSKALSQQFSKNPTSLIATLPQATTTRRSNAKWKAFGLAVINGLSASWDTPTMQNFLPLAKSETPCAGWIAEWSGNPSMRFFNHLGPLQGDLERDSRYARLRDAQCQIVVDLAEEVPYFEFPALGQ